LTSTREAMPLAVLEAHATSTPVVSYDLSYGPSSLISDGVDGYVVPWGDRDQLADRLVRLLSDPEHAAQLGRAGLDRVRARHSPAVVAMAWQKLFELVARDARS
jgi:glycosyltransferase involved in cell wall biosynthesis